MQNLQNLLNIYLPVGTIIAWYPASTSTQVPTGWTECDGQNGTPDLRGRFIMGYSSSRAYQTTGGQETVTLNLNQIPPHDHEMGGSISSDMYGDRYNNIISTERRGLRTYNAGGNSNGTTASHENMPPYVAVRYIMKTN